MTKSKKSKIVKATSATLLAVGVLAGQAEASNPLHYRSLGTGQQVRTQLVEQNAEDGQVAGWFNNNNKTADEMKNKDKTCEGNCGDDMGKDEMKGDDRTCGEGTCGDEEMMRKKARQGTGY